MLTYRGKFSPDYQEGSLGGDLNYMPGDRPNTYVKDPQAKLPGRKEIIPDKGGWSDDYSRKLPKS